MTQPLPLVVDDLSFRYNGRDDIALRHVSLELQPGSITLLAGSSGCGKTTLMRCINGLIPHSYKGRMLGEVRLFGRPNQGQPLAAISKHVGTLLQDPERQILGTYVLNEVCFGLESQGMPHTQMLARADEALERLNIAHLREKETAALSGGEKQKVALAGVLAMRPSILLLDEPLASLDPASAEEALQAFRRLADSGLSLLIVEHRVEDVLRIAPEQILYMDAGEIKYQGDAAGLMQVVDYTRIKLPAEVVMQRAKAAPAPKFLSAAPTPAPESPPLLQFEDVHFSYRPELPEVLHGLNFEVHTGDVIAVLGHNGSGKTTTVKHALGLLKPTQGQVLLEGQDSKKQSVAEAAKTIGYVFQSPSQMLFGRSVREELAFGPENLGFAKPDIEANSLWAIRSVHLEEEMASPPLALSFGQQKRVSIAAILSMRSRILVMDEPTAGQDYWNYMSFMDAIMGMPGFDAILFITHDVDLAAIYANRVLVMHGGRLAADGPPQEVLGDHEALRKWRILPTSLLKLNQQLYPLTGHYARAEHLALYSS